MKFKPRLNTIEQQWLIVGSPEEFYIRGIKSGIINEIHVANGVFYIGNNVINKEATGFSIYIERSNVIPFIQSKNIF